MARSQNILASVRSTPEVILWALAIFVAGVALLPLAHAVHHRIGDHVHGPIEAAAAAHGRPVAHGAGSQAHFGLALLEGEAPVLMPPAGGLLAELVLESPQQVTPRRYQLEPIRSQAP